MRGEEAIATIYRRSRRGERRGCGCGCVQARREQGTGDREYREYREYTEYTEYTEYRGGTQGGEAERGARPQDVVQLVEKIRRRFGRRGEGWIAGWLGVG